MMFSSSGWALGELMEFGDDQGDLRRQAHLPLLSNVSGTVLRAGYTRIQDSSICIGFLAAQCGRRMSRRGTGDRAFIRSLPRLERMVDVVSDAYSTRAAARRHVPPVYG